MMKRNARCIAAVLCVSATLCFAEQPLRSPEELRDDASHIVVGKIQKVYESTSKDGNWKHTDSVAEIRVQSVEKGKGVAKGQLLYARFWNRGWIGKKEDFPPSASGHYAVESKVGSTVRAFVVQNKEDKGFDVLLTNGMQTVKSKDEDSK